MWRETIWGMSEVCIRGLYGVMVMEDMVISNCYVVVEVLRRWSERPSELFNFRV